MEDLKAGVYRHYKGPLYLVLGLAHDANADTLHRITFNSSGMVAHQLGERTVVVYIGLQLTDAHNGPRIAVRTYDDFLAMVYTDNEHLGEVCSHVARGSTWCSDRERWVTPRFEYIGPTWEGQR